MTAALADAPRVVFLDLRDATIRLAVSFAVDEAGWARVPGPGGAVVVADRLVDRPDAPPLDALVLAPTPAASRRAVDAFARGEVRAVVSSTDPAALPRALESAREGLQVVSIDVVAAAHRFPSLSPRLERTLHLVVRGRGNREIARELGLSEATTKRDVAALLRRFDVSNRIALAATALRLGWPTSG